MAHWCCALWKLGFHFLANAEALDLETTKAQRAQWQWALHDFTASGVANPHSCSFSSGAEAKSPHSSTEMRFKSVVIVSMISLKAKRVHHCLHFPAFFSAASREITWLYASLRKLHSNLSRKSGITTESSSFSMCCHDCLF